MTIQPHNRSEIQVEEAPAINVQGLSFRYRSLDDDSDDQPAQVPQAIEDVSFSLLKGELLLIAGPSGCGKSTLLKCLNGLIPHSYHGTLQGEIQLEGKTITGLSLRDLAQRVGTMLQDPDKQIVGSTVEQEVAFGLENLNTPRDEMRLRIRTVLQRLRLDPLIKHETFALSGGQRQQVAAAGVLVMHPSVFLFDEPFASLDSQAVVELEELIGALREEKHTVVIVEHRVEEALTLKPDKILLMHEGRVVFFGDPSAFLKIADPEQVKLPIDVTLRTTNTSPEQLYQRMVRPITTGQSSQERSKDTTNQPILTFENVHYRYQSFSREILHGVSCQIHRGETIALLGPNGAGKSTLVKQALGLLRPTKGSVQLYGEDTRKLSVAQLAARIGYVFQSPGAMLFATTVRKELSFGPDNLRFSAKRVESSIQQAAEALNVKSFLGRSPFALSFGQQKRVAIASVLAMQSKILLLDEPTAGQDYRSYISFIEHLRLIPDLDALFLITHDLDLALRFAQRVLLLKDGNLIADGPPLEVLSDLVLLKEGNLRPTSLLHYLLEHKEKKSSVG